MATRKMRRSRDAGGGGAGGGGGGSSSNNNGNEESFISGFDVYSLQGDSAGAYHIFSGESLAQGDAQASSTTTTTNSPSSEERLHQQQPTLANRYNRLLLSSLIGQSNSATSSTGGADAVTATSSEVLLEKMSLMEKEFRNKSQKEEEEKASFLSPHKLIRNELILAYNRALVLFAAGRYAETERVICYGENGGLLLDMMRKKEKPPDEWAMVSSRLAFLLLECNLALTVGRTSLGSSDTSLPPSSSSSSPPPLLLPSSSSSSRVILEWLERFDTEKDPQFKFLLNLYRSRADLAVLDEDAGKHDDARIRSARKELKQAMDIFQHKLRPAFGADTGGGGAGSVVSSANSEENATYSSANNNIHTPYDAQQQTPSSVVLQRHNQSALSLKAHSEQLKGNTKKSLILCSEAHTACVDSTSSSSSSHSYYETLHANNLAVVYETIGKRHLALHALSKGLRNAAAVTAAASKNNDSSNNNKDSTTTTSSPLMFYPDGTARPDPTLLVLHNAAICAIQARHYVTAYECMATCIAQSSAVFASRPRCWLRLAEACVGIYSSELGKNGSNSNNEKRGTNKFAAIEVDGEPKGIIVENSLFTDHPELKNEELAPILGSAEDLEQVQRNPLVRARASLEHVLKHCGEKSLTPARLVMAYVHLAFGEHAKALEMAKLVLDAPEPSSFCDEVTRRCHQRRVATARMYAAEASCALGETMIAMKFLVGDGQDDAFDRLASDLSGVTIETAASSSRGKRRLARAQTVVRSSASVVTAAMGNSTAAKQLAMSAQAMEDAYYAPSSSSSLAAASSSAVNRERSCARRALAYTLLKGGQHGAALSILRSLR